MGIPVMIAGSSLSGLLLHSRTTIDLDDNAAVREQALLLATQIALHNPLRGIGYGMFAPYAAAAPAFGVYMNTHNEYLRFASESGFLTVVLLGLLLGWSLWGRRAPELTVLQAVVVTNAASLLFGNFLSNLSISVPFWVALGCLLARSDRSSTVTDPGGRTDAR